MWKWLFGIGAVAGIVTAAVALKKKPPRNTKNDPDWYNVEREFVDLGGGHSFWVTSVFFHPQKGNVQTFQVMPNPPSGSSYIYNPTVAYHVRLPWFYDNGYISKVQYDGIKSELKKYYNVTV